MPFNLSLLLSLALHAIVLFGPFGRGASPSAQPASGLEVRILPPEIQESADVVSSKNATKEPPLQPPRTANPSASGNAQKPQRMQGAALQRAQQAVSEHLFYPPEAAALGLEGVVTLLLVLDDRGNIVSSSVARSSGHAMLDRAALDATRSMGALPGNPRQTLLPVTFTLQ